MSQYPQYNFKCSNCDKELVSLIINTPSLDVEWNVVVKCCYCQDQSYEQRVKGGFIVAMASNIKLIDIDYNSDPIIIKTAKA